MMSRECSVKCNRILFILIFFSILFSTQFLFAESFVTAKPKQGDGIYTFLRRYKLPANNQSIQQFREINKRQLQTHGSLQVGLSYSLPISKYRFNGKTIRSTLGINNYSLAKQIENYNISVVTAGLKKQSYKTDRDLWVPYHLSGQSIQVENFPTGKSQRHSIFGWKYRDVEIIDNSLKGRVYYLVSGHGGPDPGAIGKSGKYRLYEDEYAYDITLRFARKLVQHGAKVYIIVRDPNDGIRDTEILRGDKDEVYLGGKRISSRPKTRLDARANIINSYYQQNRKTAKSQHVIVLHVDSRSNKKRIDIFYYYQNSSRDSKNLAFRLYRTIRDKYREVQPGRGYKGTVATRSLHMLRNCKPTTVYIELGNIRNPLDQQRFMLENNRQAVANWLCLGILNHFK
jgi:N-acetylmuramoyl-L-alanine amidase